MNKFYQQLWEKAFNVASLVPFDPRFSLSWMVKYKKKWKRMNSLIYYNKKWTNCGRRNLHVSKSIRSVANLGRNWFIIFSQSDILELFYEQTDGCHWFTKIDKQNLPTFMRKKSQILTVAIYELFSENSSSKKVSIDFSLVQ